MCLGLHVTRGASKLLVTSVTLMSLVHAASQLLKHELHDNATLVSVACRLVSVQSGSGSW